MLQNAWGDFKDWTRKPFSADMSAVEWFAFIGLLIVVMALWRMIFMHIEEGLN